MDFNILKEIARPQWMQILAAVKRSQGLAVGMIAMELGSSYMGVKQHCESMVRIGLLETARRPRPQGKRIGRPEKVYRLTGKAQQLFPAAGNEVVLDLLKTVGEIHGDAASEKLLYNFFQTKTKFYKNKVKGKSVVERATALAKLREGEGYLSRVVYDNTNGLRIEEFHHPMEVLCRTYPVLLNAEEQMFESVLGTKVTRESVRQGGQTVQKFFLNTL